MKNRKASLEKLKASIERQRVSITKSKEVVAGMEARLEKTKAELLFQQMLERLDALDDQRWQQATALVEQKVQSDGHIDELERVDQL